MRPLLVLAALALTVPAAADVADPATPDAGRCTPVSISAADECVSCVNSYCGEEGYRLRCVDRTDAGLPVAYWCKVDESDGCRVGQGGAVAGGGGLLLLAGLVGLWLRRRVTPV